LISADVAIWATNRTEIPRWFMAAWSTCGAYL
jgi:hypothetical protein